MNKQYKIFNENGIHIDGSAIDQFFSCLSFPWAIQGALMPDAHKGYGLPIGGVVATEGMVVPSWVGFDIGCGVSAIRLPIKKDKIIGNKDKIFVEIYKNIPTGFSHNQMSVKWDHSKIQATDALKSIISKKEALNQLATLGGGNHFIEIGYDSLDCVWIVIHSGSRGIGHAVATHYMKVASGDDKAREGTYPLPVNSNEGNDYITDLNWCLEFAFENRKRMTERVIKAILGILNTEKDMLTDLIHTKLSKNDFINRNHNHAIFKDGLWIHRKGATHAENGMHGVIPGNMKDGSFITMGKGNYHSLCSSSHGAGRVMGRREANENIDIKSFEKIMDGIVAKVDENTLDEAPFAYKNIFDVMEAQKDLVEVLYHIKPLINVKG